MVGYTEVTGLAAMKALAMRIENIMVARYGLLDMRLGREEQIRSFYARIKGQADTCDYRIKCTKADCNEMVEFAGEMLDLMSDQNQNMTIEEKIKFVEARESGKRSASRLLYTPSVNAASSTYRHNKQQEVRTTGTATTKPIPDLKPEQMFEPNAQCRLCGEKENPMPSVRQAM